MDSYRLGLRAAIRGLWGGLIGYMDAYDMAFSAIHRRLTQAWHEGLAEFGIAPDEMTADEQIALDGFIAEQLSYLNGLLSSVMEQSKANGYKLGPHLSRVDLWVNRYRDARNKAKQMAGGDQKLEWVLGPTEHCSSCLKLAGKVKRASQWESYGIRPQMPSLECGGYNCQCELVPTDAPMSMGPLPKIP